MCQYSGKSLHVFLHQIINKVNRYNNDTRLNPNSKCNIIVQSQKHFSLKKCFKYEPLIGIEPMTFSLPWKCSTS